MVQYNPKTVLRQIGNPMLKAFFEHHGHTLDADWENLGPRQIQDICQRQVESVPLSTCILAPPCPLFFSAF